MAVEPELASILAHHGGRSRPGPCAGARPAASRCALTGRNSGPSISAPCLAKSRYARIHAAVCGFIARASRRPHSRVTRNESSPRFWYRSPSVSAAISARCNRTCGAAERIARSRSPAIVSSGGALRALRSRAFEKASVAPSSRLIAGRSTSPTECRGTWAWRIRCF